MLDERRLWDDDAAYAPCVSPSYSKWTGKTYVYWRCPRKYLAMGYPVRLKRLSGEKGDDKGLIRAAEARALTRQMLGWFGIVPRGGNGQRWAWVIAAFKSDRYSHYGACKANTRASYDPLLSFWEREIGNLPIGTMTYARAMDVRARLEAEGGSSDSVRRRFQMLGMLARYARGPLASTDAVAVVNMLSELRFEAAPKRTVAPTRAQIRAVIDEADARGWFAFATGLLIQWTYSLRSVDVRGQWLPSDGQGGIVRGKERWQDGLTWDMLDRDLTRIEKVISKTAKTMTAPLCFEVTPELRVRLCLLGNAGRVGPVIVNPATGLPYDRKDWSRLWTTLRDDLGLPPELRVMDTRAGAITEAKALGLDPYAVRDAAGHMRVETTDHYARARSENANRVVKLRGL